MASRFRLLPTAVYRLTARISVACLAILAIGGCTGISRLPAVTLALSHQARPLDIADARFYEDDVHGMRSLVQRLLEKERQRGTIDTSATLPPRHYLAISGGLVQDFLSAGRKGERVPVLMSSPESAPAHCRLLSPFLDPNSIGS
jgi:hypothetical protein